VYAIQTTVVLSPHFLYDALTTETLLPGLVLTGALCEENPVVDTFSVFEG
jgi:hypothetical protein